MDRDGHRRGLDLTAKRSSLPPAAAALLFLAAVVLPLFRNQGIPVWDSIWIEDSLFAEQANQNGPFAVMFRSYSGYLQLMIRIQAIPTAILPSAWIAAYLAVAATFVCALAAAFAYAHTEGLVKAIGPRLLIAAMVVIGPAMAIENTANITNTIWAVLAVAPFAFLSLKERRRDIAVRAAVVFFAATATALSALFLPLAIGAVIVRRSRSSIVVAAVYAIGLVLQAAIVVISPDGPRAPSEVRALVDMFGVRVLGSFLVGERPLGQLWMRYDELVVVVAVLLTVAIFWYLLRGAGRRNQILAGILLAYAGAAFALPAWGRGTSAIGFEVGVYSLNTTRYTVGPIVLLVAAAAVLVSPGLEPRVRSLSFDGVKVLVVWTSIVVALSFILPTGRGDGPAWRAEAARVYADECGGEPSDRLVRVVTTPESFSLGLTCSRLASV